VRRELVQDFTPLLVHLPFIPKDVLGSDAPVCADFAEWDLSLVQLLNQVRARHVQQIRSLLGGQLSMDR
jgi:hypothetical protein